MPAVGLRYSLLVRIEFAGHLFVISHRVSGDDQLLEARQTNGRALSPDDDVDIPKPRQFVALQRQVDDVGEVPTDSSEDGATRDPVVGKRERLDFGLKFSRQFEDGGGDARAAVSLAGRVDVVLAEFFVGRHILERSETRGLVQVWREHMPRG
jgi:hypothetical protein